MVKRIKVDWSLGNKKPLARNLHKKDKVFALIQARKTSTRFPDKIYSEINGCPMIYHVIDRVEQAELVDKTIVASPHRLDDLPFGTNTFIYEEDENDVLSRFYWASKINPADYYVRVTSDCPMLDPHLIDFVVYSAVNASADYCSNVMSFTFPDGLDTEVLNRKTLQLLHQSVNAPQFREHVTLAIRENPLLQKELNCVSVENKTDLSGIKISVDTKEDLERVREMEKNR